MKLASSVLLCLLGLSFLSCSKNIKSLSEETTAPSFSKFSHATEVKAFQAKLNKDYSDPKESPLPEDKIAAFEEEGGHHFFPIDHQLRIVAAFEKSKDIKDVGFKTTTERIAMYDVYGVAKFKLDDKEYAVNVYQSHRLRDMDEYKEHLFFPFNDLTNGETSYGGGRYIDLTIPKGNTIVIDFNKSYNPYCAYTSGYSCPIPPIENYIDSEIKAGIMLTNKDH